MNALRNDPPRSPEPTEDSLMAWVEQTLERLSLADEYPQTQITNPDGSTITN